MEGCKMKNTTNVDAMICVLSSWNYLLIIPMIPQIIVDASSNINGSTAKNINFRDYTLGVSSLTAPLCKKQSNENIS